MRFAVSCLAVLALAGAARAQDDGGASDAPHPLTLRVGESIAICATGTIVCPAGAAVCDDLSVALPVGDPERGLVLKGLKPGSTLCSAAGSSGQGTRRTYRVTVTR